MREALLTTEQVAGFLRFKTQTVRKWRARQAGPKFYRIGRAVRYKPEDVCEWLEQESARIEPKMPDMATFLRNKARAFSKLHAAGE